MKELLPATAMVEDVYGDDPSARLLPEEVAAVEHAVEKRRREYTIARSCARRALVRLGFEEIPILRSPEREPLWPAGVVGSITHCEGYCAAAVARARDIPFLGIDAEPHRALPDGVLDRIALPSERTRIAAMPAGTHWDRLLFSAKEAVYKAFFPLTHSWLGFEDAELTIHPSNQTFEARLLGATLLVEGRRLNGFRGRYAVRGSYVLTAIAATEGDTGIGQLAQRKRDILVSSST